MADAGAPVLGRVGPAVLGEVPWATVSVRNASWLPVTGTTTLLSVAGEASTVTSLVLPSEVSSTVQDAPGLRFA